jgi:AbrB family looped-hinge helix DNA binding protein
MKTTIDRAGRVVIPKEVRQAAGLRPGDSIDVVFQEGEVAIRPTGVEMRLEKRGRFTVIVPETAIEPLSQEVVERTLEQVREDRTHLVEEA